MSPRRGFSLVELLVTLVVVAILAGLALPGYRHVLRRSYRSDAREALLQLQALQERHYFEHGHYAASLEDLGSTAASGRSFAGHYVLETEAAFDGQGFLLRARPAPGGLQADDADCRELTLDDRGHRGATGAVAEAARVCWN